jgi:hypothetical protein
MEHMQPLPNDLKTRLVACGSWLSQDHQLGYVIRRTGASVTVSWRTAFTTVHQSERSLALDQPPALLERPCRPKVPPASRSTCLLTASPLPAYEQGWVWVQTVSLYPPIHLRFDVVAPNSPLAAPSCHNHTTQATEWDPTRPPHTPPQPRSPPPSPCVPAQLLARAVSRAGALSYYYYYKMKRSRQRQAYLKVSHPGPANHQALAARVTHGDVIFAHRPQGQAEFLTASLATVSAAPITTPDAQDDGLSAPLQETTLPRVSQLWPLLATLSSWG